MSLKLENLTFGDDEMKRQENKISFSHGEPLSEE
jgi:hypothetical protein